MIDVTEILTLIIRLIFAVVAAFVIPWIESKVSAEKLTKAKNLVKIAVQAAEMLYDAGDGVSKKRYVLDYIHMEFSRLHLEFDGDTINNMIESAVLELGSKLG